MFLDVYFTSGFPYRKSSQQLRRTTTYIKRCIASDATIFKKLHRMKNLILILLFIPLVFTSCSSLKQPKFKKKFNVKEFVISKYGKPNIIHNKEEDMPNMYGDEVWKYESDKILKNNRTIVFKENKIIYHQKKLKPISFVVTNLLGYGATILTVFGLIAAMLGHI